MTNVPLERAMVAAVERVGFALEKLGLNGPLTDSGAAEVFANAVSMGCKDIGDALMEVAAAIRGQQ